MTDLLAPLRPGERFNMLTIPLHLVDRLVGPYGLEVFIESGTYLGFTVEAVKSLFLEVHTIELDETLARDARRKFANDTHVAVWHGDSATLLAEVLDGQLGVPAGGHMLLVESRALVWLDAHFSGGITTGHSAETDTAIRGELAALRVANRVGQRRDHVLLIDDVDDFDGRRGYPTRDELIGLVKEINPEYEVSILDLRRGVLVALPPI